MCGGACLGRAATLRSRRKLGDIGTHKNVGSTIFVWALSIWEERRCFMFMFMFMFMCCLTRLVTHSSILRHDMYMYM